MKKKWPAKEYGIVAHAVDRHGRRKRIKADAIHFQLGDGGQIVVNLVGMPNKKVLAVATGAIASGKKHDDSCFTIVPACSNVLYLTIKHALKEDPTKT